MRFFIKRKENRFWKGNKLIEEDLIKSNIDHVIDKLSIREGQFRINGVYLFGSVYELKDKKKYRREPRDLDLYFWINDDSDWDLPRRIQDEIRSRPKAYGLEVQPLVFSHHPFSHGEIDNISGVHALYRHPDIMRLKPTD